MDRLIADNYLQSPSIICSSDKPARHPTRLCQPPLNLLRSIVRSRPSPAEDGGVRRFPPLACLAALGQDAGGTTRMAPAGSSALASPHGMRNRIHRSAAIVRLAPEPALAPRLAETDIHVLGVADGADGRPAFGADTADFP